jgi:hypothetical protein
MNDNNNGMRGVFTSKKNAFHAFMSIANDLGHRDMEIFHEGKMREFKPYLFRGHMIQIDFIDSDGDRCEFTIEKVAVNYF